MNNIQLLKEKLTPYDIGHKKVHLGPKYDGGYVISQDCLNKTDVVYSLGIGSECDFDLELADMGYKIYQYEANHPAPFKTHDNFFYKQMFINAGNLHAEIYNNKHDNTNILLSMDIEGGEYDVLLHLPEKSLLCFNQICFEIHDVLYHSMATTVVERLQKNFVLMHIHANNNCIRQGAYSSGINQGVPNVLELTYVRKDCINITPAVSRQACPVQDLDFKNQLDLPEVHLDWWIK